MSPNWLKQLFARKTWTIRRTGRRAHRPQCRRTPMRLEQLEDRLAPAVTLFYYGAGSTLNLLETSAGSDAVTVSEPAGNTLRINLGGATFEVGSSTASGLSYADPD